MDQESAATPNNKWSKATRVSRDGRGASTNCFVTVQTTRPGRVEKYTGTRTYVSRRLMNYTSALSLAPVGALVSLCECRFRYGPPSNRPRQIE